MISTGPEQFSGEITLSSRIVDYLSSGLYKSPGSCLKELINNSYDADATEVYVMVKPDADSIIIEDNGTGMTKEEFQRHFERVAESHKRDIGDRTPSRRKKIGYIGIGFIAANELCHEMHILSTKRGSTELLNVVIDFDRMSDPLPRRRRDTGTDIAKADYSGIIEKTDVGSHYTKVFLRRVRKQAQELVVSAKRAASTSNSRHSLYGMTASQVQSTLADPKIKSWDEFDYYSKTMLEVALNVPVSYGDCWTPPEHTDSVEWFTQQAHTANFRVIYDGTDLRKPTTLRQGTDGRSLVHCFQIKAEELSARCYIYAGRHVLKPEQLNGILIRVRSAAVGEYDPSFLGFPRTINTLLQRWISGEIWASDELEDAMNIDRRTIRDAHPAYSALRESFHSELRMFLRTVRSELYDRPTVQRNRAKAVREIERIGKVTRARLEREAYVTPKARSEVDDLLKKWTLHDDDLSQLRKVTRRYSVSEMYSIVLDIATDVLPPDQVMRLMSALSDRLRT